MRQEKVLCITTLERGEGLASMSVFSLLIHTQLLNISLYGERIFSWAIHSATMTPIMKFTMGIVICGGGCGDKPWASPPLGWRIPSDWHDAIFAVLFFAVSFFSVNKIWEMKSSLRVLFAEPETLTLGPLLGDAVAVAIKATFSLL